MPQYKFGQDHQSVLPEKLAIDSGKIMQATLTEVPPGSWPFCPGKYYSLQLHVSSHNQFKAVS